MTIPLDVYMRQEFFGHVELAWIGDHEVSITVDAGSGGLLVTLFDHCGEQAVFSGVYQSIGKARRSFNRTCERAMDREVAA